MNFDNLEKILYVNQYLNAISIYVAPNAEYLSPLQKAPANAIFHILR